jgi:uracil-DNA glycosylase
LEIALVIGQYAQAYHLADKPASLTDAVNFWATYWPTVVQMPHPIPRNNLWISRNPWFQWELLPALRARLSEVLA